MGLLEIVKNENNDLDKINELKKFCEIELGKGAIVCLSLIHISEPTRPY